MSPVRGWLSVVVTGAVLLALAPMARANEPAAVNVADIRPTQAEIGRATVHDIVAGWKADARRRNMPLARYVRTVLRPERAKKAVAVIIDPAGHVRTFDGHHRIAALQEIQAETGVSLDLDVRVAKDYRGTSIHDYAADLLATGRMRGAPRSLSLSPEAQLATIPDSFAQMRDDPLRTIIGRVFNRSGISGSEMTNYIEFQVADRLRANGLLTQLKRDGLIPASAERVPPSATNDPRVERAIERRILGSKRMIGFLMRSARSEKFARAVRLKVRKAVRAARRQSPRPGVSASSSQRLVQRMRQHSVRARMRQAREVRAGLRGRGRSAARPRVRPPRRAPRARR